jgi:hypothetical protein
MARRDATCLVCGRTYTDYDAAPRWFCSVACEADAGTPTDGLPTHTTGRGRAARTPPRRKPDDG